MSTVKRERRDKTQPHTLAYDTVVVPGPLATPCRLWRWGTAGLMGYGKFQINKKHFYAHRYYYEKVNGKIPPGKELDHLFRMPRCCAVEHLEPVTRAENCRRSTSTTLTKYQVVVLRNYVAAVRRSGWSPVWSDIGIAFGVSPVTARMICWRGTRNWRSDTEIAKCALELRDYECEVGDA